jgi:hypothetical protein
LITGSAERRLERERITSLSWQTYGLVDLRCEREEKGNMWEMSGKRGRQGGAEGRKLLGDSE